MPLLYKVAAVELVVFSFVFYFSSTSASGTRLVLPLGFTLHMFIRSKREGRCDSKDRSQYPPLRKSVRMSDTSASAKDNLNEHQSEANRAEGIVKDPRLSVNIG
jgi:hypothetical protein